MKKIFHLSFLLNVPKSNKRLMQNNDKHKNKRNYQSNNILEENNSY